MIVKAIPHLSADTVINLGGCLFESTSTQSVMPRSLYRIGMSFPWLTVCPALQALMLAEAFVDYWQSLFVESFPLYYTRQVIMYWRSAVQGLPPGRVTLWKGCHEKLKLERGTRPDRKAGAFSTVNAKVAAYSSMATIGLLSRSALSLYIRACFVYPY